MTPHCVRLTPYTHSTHTLCRLHLAMSTAPVHVGCQNFLSIPLHDNTLRTSDTLHTLDTYSLPCTSCDVDNTCACRMSEFPIYSTTWHHIAYVWHPTHSTHTLCRLHLVMSTAPVHVGCQNFLSVPLHDTTLRTSDTLHTLDTYSLPFTSCDVDNTCACRMSEFPICSTTWHHISYFYDTLHTLDTYYSLPCTPCDVDSTRACRMSESHIYFTTWHHISYVRHPTHTLDILFAVYNWEGCGWFRPQHAGLKPRGTRGAIPLWSHFDAGIQSEIVLGCLYYLGVCTVRSGVVNW